jgi:hypothetical protein
MIEWAPPIPSVKSAPSGKEQNRHALKRTRYIKDAGRFSWIVIELGGFVTMREE